MLPTSSRCQATSATSTASRSTGSLRNWSQSWHGMAHTGSRSSAAPARWKRGQATGRAQAGRSTPTSASISASTTPRPSTSPRLQQLIKKLLAAAYPQKNPDDFEEGARVFGIVFKGTGLEVDLVPIVSLDSERELRFPVLTHRGPASRQASRSTSITTAPTLAAIRSSLHPCGWPSAGATGRNSTASSRST